MKAIKYTKRLVKNQMRELEKLMKDLDLVIAEIKEIEKKSKPKSSLLS